MTNRVTPKSRGKTKQKILNGLLGIYENWKNQLDKLGQPYYLKVWLFEPRFSQSKVVWAIVYNVDLNKNTFFKPDMGKDINLDNYRKLKIGLYVVKPT